MSSTSSSIPQPRTRAPSVRNTSPRPTTGWINRGGGYRVFCNPPYGRQIAEWVRKGYEEGQKPGTLVAMLIPARTDTQYWHDYVLNGKADEVRFIRGRLKFTDEDGKAKDTAPFPSALVIWRGPDMTKKPTACTTM